jgi:hypothetical protein
MILNSPYVSGSLTVTGNEVVTGSLTVLGGITGAITGSATSASFAASATSASFALNATSASYALNSTSASFATRAITASYADALTVAGTLTAQTLVVQTITSSVSTITGSTNFGSLLANTHAFTGSVSITGSLTVVTTGTELQVTSTGVRIGNVIGDAHSITGSVGISGSATFASGVTFSSTTSHTGTAGFGVGSPTAIDGADGRIITDKIRLYNGNPATQYHNIISAATQNRDLIIPNASGTMALTSDLSAYLPLGGGNMTGNLQITGQPNPTITFTTNTTTTTSMLQIIGAQFVSSAPFNANRILAANSSHIAFEAGGAERMRILSDGNVGIGITSPQARLDVLSTLNVQATGNSDVPHINFSNNGRSFDWGRIGGLLQGDGDGALYFQTKLGGGLTEKMRITSGGNVGINKPIPDTNSLLDVNGQAFVARLALYNDNGTPSLGTSPMLYSPASATLAISTGTTERMRITSGGVLVNQGGIYDTSANVVWIARQGGNDRIIANGNGYVFMPFLTTGSGIDDLGWWGSSNVSWTYAGMLMRISSSARYKKNIRDLELDSTKIFDLRAISYENNENTAVDGLTSFGLLAEDVAEKIPMLATYNQEGQPEGVQYKMLAVLLLEEMKKMKLEINELKAQ